MDPRTISFLTDFLNWSVIVWYPSEKNLIESEIPASLPAVVKKLIPPKGIKHKNQEGYELLDFVCPDDA